MPCPMCGIVGHAYAEYVPEKKKRSFFRPWVVTVEPEHMIFSCWMCGYEKECSPGEYTLIKED